MASNKSVDSGCGIRLTTTFDALVQNCLITGNTLVNNGFGYGGAISVHAGDLSRPASIVNSTCAYNSASAAGGIDANAPTNIYNSIIIGNTKTNGTLNQIEVVDSHLNIDFSDVQDGMSGIGNFGTLTYGRDNIDVDPQFTDFDGVDNDVLTWRDNNYRVLRTSPIIDAASNSQVPADQADLDNDGITSEPTPLDLDRIARFRDIAAVINTGEGTNLIVDMGAYEVPTQFPGILYTKDRYISFMPNMVANMTGEMSIIRVTRQSDSTVRYVDCARTPFQNVSTETCQYDAGGNPIPGTCTPDPDALLAGSAYTLTTSPIACVWEDLIIHVTGCEIIPGDNGETYVVETSTDGGIVYNPLTTVLTTPPQSGAGRNFGDTVGNLVGGFWTAPNGSVTASDIVVAVQTFGQTGNPPHPSRVDNAGKVPNHIVGGDDILNAVQGFAGACYNQKWKCNCGIGCSSVDDPNSSCAGESSGGTPSTFSIVASSSTINPTETVNIDVFIDATSDLAGYEVAINMAVWGLGSLDLESISVDENRSDFVFNGKTVITALDNVTGRIAVVTDDGSSVTVTGLGYLGTLTYRASLDADGLFNAVIGQGERAFLLDSNIGRIPSSQGSSILIGVDVLCVDDASCDDSNPCTDDTCDPQAGCANVNNDANACDDGNACTSDACVAGTCQATNWAAGTSCDDGQSCTGTDTCDGAGVCNHSGNSCKSGQICCECFGGVHACAWAPSPCFCPF